MIPFGEWLPDQPDHLNPGALKALNVIPGDKSYHPFHDKVVYSSDLATQCRGFAAFTNTLGDYFNFAGTQGNLYLLSAASYGVVSGASYSLPAGYAWKFSQYGNDAIATNIGDYPQKFTMGTDAAFSDLSTAFKASYVDVVRNFLVFGNTIDTETVPNRLRWSAQGDHTNYTVSPVTQSDYQDLPAVDGDITGIVGGSYGVIFQEHAIQRMTYVGSPIVFQFDKMESRGTKYPNSIINSGSLIAYLSDDGFFVFDGAKSVGIGDGKINRTFFNDLDQNYPNLVIGVHEPINHLFIWGYVGRNKNTSLPDKMIIFNYSPNAEYRWSQAEVTHEWLGRARISGVSVAKDFRFWTSTNDYLACFDTDHKLNLFTGDSLDATIETGEAEIYPGAKANITKVRPDVLLVDGASQTDLWTSRTPAESNNYYSVTWADSLNLFVAVSLDGSGDGGLSRVMTSPDGFSWTARSASVVAAWGCVCWSGALLVAVALTGASRIMTSTDGTNWMTRAADELNGLTSVAWSQSLGIFALVSLDGTNQVQTSADGTTWAAISVPSGAWRSICWSPTLGMFAAVASSGANQVMTSTNGSTWTARTAAEANDWNSVCWSIALGMFVAVSRSGTHKVMTSTDGITWAAGTAPGDEWHEVCASDDLGIVVAVSAATSGSTNQRAMISSDGEVWTIYDTSDDLWRSICWSPDLYRFVAVGDAAVTTSQAETPGAATVQIGTRDSNARIITWGDEISPEDNGDYPARSNARYHRIRVNISGAFENAQGVNITGYRSGIR